MMTRSNSRICILGGRPAMVARAGLRQWWKRGSTARSRRAEEALRVVNSIVGEQFSRSSVLPALGWRDSQEFAMPSAQYLHPEFGYLGSAPRWRRDLKVAAVSVLFGAIAGVGGLAVLIADRDSKTEGPSTSARIEASTVQPAS